MLALIEIYKKKLQYQIIQYREETKTLIFQVIYVNKHSPAVMHVHAIGLTPAIVFVYNNQLEEKMHIRKLLPTDTKIYFQCN